jgi:hypothetical protein
VAFYEFTRTMQSYKSIIAENTTLVLSTGSDLFKFLKGMGPERAITADIVPWPTRSLRVRQRDWPFSFFDPPSDHHGVPSENE